MLLELVQVALNIVLQPAKILERNFGLILRLALIWPDSCVQKLVQIIGFQPVIDQLNRSLLRARSFQNQVEILLEQLVLFLNDLLLAQLGIWLVFQHHCPDLLGHAGLITFGLIFEVLKRLCLFSFLEQRKAGHLGEIFDVSSLGWREQLVY